MKCVWIFLALVALYEVHATSQEYAYDDYFNYDDLEDLEKSLNDEYEKKAVNDNSDTENDLKVEEEIKQYREADDDKLDNLDEFKDYIDSIEDSQLEDRSNQKDDDDDSEIVDDGKDLNDLVENRPEPDDPNAPSRNEDYALLWGDDSIAPLPVPDAPEEEENKDIFEETQKILEESDAENFEEEIKKALESDASIQAEEQQNKDQILEETKRLLEETDDKLDIEIPVDDNAEQVNDDDKKSVENEKADKLEEKTEDEDTVDKAYADLNADLDKLFETLDKLKKEVTDDSNNDDIKSSKNNEEADDIIMDNKSSTEKQEKKLVEEKDIDREGIPFSEEVVEDIEGDGNVDLDQILENILSEDDFKPEESEEVFESLLNDAIDESNPEDTGEKDVETFADDKELEQLNEALSVKAKKDTEDINPEEDTNEEEEDTNEDDNDSVSEDKNPVEVTNIDNLSSSELDELVSQFSVLHKEDLDVHADNFKKDVTPVHITLKIDEPTVITSPNYPSPYTTNNIVDWILEGNGMGIELNITDFAVNGALGDYLLIKPGGVDETSHGGLLFTYHLNSERRYRFTDVNRLFIRFESKVGMMFFRGFSLSAKLMGSDPSQPEDIPEPQPVIAEPHSTVTVTLAIRVPDFKDVKEDFRQVLADMATQYIDDNNIDPGLNTTSEVTTITHVGLCPVSWPNFEECTAVTFSVSLVYDEEDHEPRLNTEDLTSMWVVYSQQDPFESRLSAMGIAEFDGPNSAALTNWLLVTLGVMVAMMLVALVLWRYSCFEGYTRMKAFSDTDSIRTEKRNLDLYPTPHQNLPPLYAEQEYKWPEQNTATVDMGGFANRSYTRDNMYDFDSDEDVIASRDRNGAVTAKDFSIV